MFVGTFVFDFCIRCFVILIVQLHQAIVLSAIVGKFRYLFLILVLLGLGAFSLLHHNWSTIAIWWQYSSAHQPWDWLIQLQGSCFCACDLRCSFSLGLLHFLVARDRLPPATIWPVLGDASRRLAGACIFGGHAGIILVWFSRFSDPLSSNQPCIL